MKRFLILLPLFLFLLSLSSCHHQKELSPYEEIVNREPFAPLTDSIRQFPEQDELWLKRAVLLNKNDFPEPALADFRKAWSLKKDERYALGIGTILLDKNPDSALAFLNEALKDLPNSLLLKLSLVHAYDIKGETDAALATCNLVLRDHPDEPVVLKMAADLLDKIDKPDSAILLLERAYRVTPFDVDLNYSLAYRYAENRNARVLSLCDSLIKKDSLHLHPEPYYYKGIYYSNTNDKTAALAMFDQAIQHDFYYLNAYIEKGRVYYDQKKMAEALKIFKLVNTISPKFPDSWFWMARCQEAMGNKEEAKLNYQKAYGLDPAFTEAKEAAEKIINQ